MVDGLTTKCEALDDRRLAMVAKEMAKAGHPTGYPKTETSNRPASAQSHTHGRHSSGHSNEKTKWLQKHADRLVVVEFRSGNYISPSELCMYDRVWHPFDIHIQPSLAR